MIARALLAWPLRRWATALVVAVAVLVAIAIPTALIETPYFGREIPPPWWAWPALGVSATLSGMLVATYVNPAPGLAQRPESAGKGWFGAALTFFAVGCPVCNKLVLLALGYTGALAWFEPVQPLLQLGAVVLLAWALVQRLRGEVACSVTGPTATGAEQAVTRPGA